MQHKFSRTSQITLIDVLPYICVVYITLRHNIFECLFQKAFKIIWESLY